MLQKSVCIQGSRCLSFIECYLEHCVCSLTMHRNESIFIFILVVDYVVSLNPEIFRLELPVCATTGCRGLIGSNSNLSRKWSSPDCILDPGAQSRRPKASARKSPVRPKSLVYLGEPRCIYLCRNKLLYPTLLRIVSLVD